MADLFSAPPDSITDPETGRLVFDPRRCGHSASTWVLIADGWKRLQCDDCGKIHGRRHKARPGDDRLPHANTELPMRVARLWYPWHYKEQQRKARDRREVQRRIQLGKHARYLASEEWKRKAALRMDIDNGICQHCGDKAVHVHHLTYARWGAEPLHDLVSLCRACHEAARGRKLH